MENSRIDPFFFKFMNQTYLQQVEAHIRVDRCCFEYSKLPVSNDKDSERLLKFKEELDYVFLALPHSKIINYLSNVSVLEVLLDLRDAEKLLELKHFIAIQLFDSSSQCL